MEPLLSLSLSLFLFTGCDNAVVEEDYSNIQKSESNKPCDFTVHGIYFNNGVPSITTNNMLHFSSWDEFENTIDALDDAIEDHEDNFVNSHSTLSEDDLNDLEESSGFNEDQPLVDFEDSHEFGSLRSVLVDDENAWLDASDQTGWSWDDDPDVTALIFGTERTLYNPQNEIMICNQIHKEMSDGYLVIDSTVPNATNALSMANNGASTQEVLDAYAGSIEEPTGVSGEVYTEQNCLYKMKDLKRFVRPDNKYRVKGIQSISGFTRGEKRFGKYFKYKSITKNYKRKGSKWKKRRIESWARIVGEVHNLDTGECGDLVDLDTRCTYKKRRRRKEVKKYKHIPGVTAEKMGTDFFKLESEHKQHNSVYRYYYD